MEPIKNIYIKIRESLKEEHRHMAIPQTGAACIATNADEKILLVKKSNGNKWVIPGGVQELGEDFRSVAARELREETGINYNQDELILVDILTGEGRHKTYPNGDEVYNNTVLFLASNIAQQEISINSTDYQDDGLGNYQVVQESTAYEWFDINSLPNTFDDHDLIEAYKKHINKSTKPRRINMSENLKDELKNTPGLIDDMIASIDKKIAELEAEGK